MKKIKHYFYIYEKKPVNWLISKYTALFPCNIGSVPTSHSEIGWEEDGRYLCFSSTNRDGDSGTRIRPEKEVLKHPERWEIIEEEVTEEQLEGIKTRARSIIGKKYDWLGLAGFISTSLFNQKDKWYCSEACYYVYFGIWKKRISPRRWYLYVEKIIRLAEKFQGVKNKENSIG